jgi:hypothetical protein
MTVSGHGPGAVQSFRQAKAADGSAYLEIAAVTR